MSRAAAYADELGCLREEALDAHDQERADELSQIADVLKIEIADARTWRDAEPLACTECDRNPRRDENAADDWRVESVGLGELLVFCPKCWQREFGSMKD